ncbi:cytochrome P450 [Dactylonectria estremocensis]|uniref:Cytochrome P450 n=1 Tax=Dactylonectria estremocensis TaxID=1079267 RepID=A0A9P9ECW3_9HYPO|nr:cytochrome P450 [Dactylonectria estremocensis]
MTLIDLTKELAATASSLKRSQKVLLLLLFAISTFLVVIFYRLYLHPLRRVPGPFLARITELWRTTKYAKGNWHQDILNLHNTYGPVVRVSPNEVSIVDKKGLVEVYGHGKGTRKTRWYDTWRVPGFRDSFFNTTDTREHAFLRKRVASAYSMSSILSLEAQLQEIATGVWEQLDSFAISGKALDMHDWASYFAFDVVGKIALGSPIGFVREATDIMNIIQSIHAGFYQMANLGYVPGQMKWINNFITQLILKFMSRGEPNSFGDFQAWNFQQVQNRLNEPEGSDRTPDLLDHFIAMREPDGSKATIASVMIETGNIIGAGADTTSVGIRSVLSQLIAHQDDYLRVRDEVDQAYAQGFDSPGGSGIPYLVAEKLPYLNACVKEGLRLHPSILWQLPREAPKNGVEIAGHYIPSSATISMSPIAQNRDKSVFGPDAGEWKPSRWIISKEVTEVEVREMDKYNVTFGYGSRTCIGRNLALVEIFKFIADFVRRYDAKFTNELNPFNIKSQWFSVQKDMYISLNMRQKQ